MIRTKDNEAYQLGTWMGRKQAFTSLAGRCSAADAECLRQIREQRRYRALNLNWKQFCEQHVGASHVTVDKVIHRLEEFGPQYFLLVQATGISDNDYRNIHSRVAGEKLLHAGEEIPISAENAPRLSAAIEQMRREAALLPAVAESKAGPAVAEAETEPVQANAKARVHPDSATERAAVAREMKRAEREVRAGLDRYERLSARRLEARTRAAMAAVIHTLACRAWDLCEDSRLG